MLKLPLWVIPDKFSAKYDIESATPLEMTGRLYAKMNELIESYNKYCENINKAIEEYEAANNKDYNCFTQTVTKLTSDYIGMVDLKIIQHDRKFEEHFKSFTSEIVKTTEKIISDLKANGELDATILEAVGELETKFGTFKDEINATVDDIKSENNSFKTLVDGQQTEFLEKADSVMANLETDYQNTKAALDSDYQNTKAALDSNYQTVKSELGGEYEVTLHNLNNDFSNLENHYNENVQALVDTNEFYKEMLYIHTVCIYGTFTKISGTSVKLAFTFTISSNKSEPYATVGEALKSLPKYKRHAIDGLLRFPGWDDDKLFAGCYLPQSEANGDRYWLFGYHLDTFSATNGPYNTPLDGPDGGDVQPMNLFDFLSDLKIIDEVYNRTTKE